MDRGIHIGLKDEIKSKTVISTDGIYWKSVEWQTKEVYDTQT